MLIRYIRNDLEGVYTAEMLRGSISMLAGIAFYELSGPGAAGAYILIIALYGLRALAGKTLIRRLLSMAASLILLSSVLFSGIFFGHERLIVPQALLTCLLSAATVYCLARLKDFSGTVMFMSIFEVVAFGMGLIDRGREVTAEGLLTACAAGSVSVLLAVILVPFTRFHWCGMINRCFYHDLRLYALMMGSAEFYESFTDLPQKRKSRILALQSALLNTSEHVLDPVRRGRYQSILNGLILICYWPTAGTEPEHIARINRIRSGIFSCVAGMLVKGRNSSRAAAAADECRRMLSVMPEDRFCNGEMTRHALRVLDDLTSLLREDRGYEYGAAMPEKKTEEYADGKRADSRNHVLMLQMAAMAVTMAIAEGVSFLCSAEQSFWIPLTAFCVSLYIDTPLTALRRTVNRILGSIYGVIIAGLVCLAFPEQEAMLVFLVVFAGLTLWSRVFFKFYYFFVAFMTATVIMLLSILMIHTPLTPDYLITERLIFTAGGAFISLAVSAVIMPSLERLDMLRTYRHYLTRFYLEYRASLNRLSGTGPEEGAAVIQGVFRSARDYSEKLPLWSYALLFDRFVYRSFVRFLHRIHKMRIMNAAVASSIDSVSLPEAEGRTASLLTENRRMTKKVILSLMLLDRERAQGYLRKLSAVNEELSETEEFMDNRMATVVIAIRDIELDLSHLTNGTLQLYLAWKNSSGHELR